MMLSKADVPKSLIQNLGFFILAPFLPPMKAAAKLPVLPSNLPKKPAASSPLTPIFALPLKSLEDARAEIEYGDDQM